MVVNTKQLNVAIKNVNAVQKRTGITNNLTNIIHLKTKDNILTIENTNGFCLHQSKLYVTDSTDFDILLDKINPVTTKENTTEIELVKVDNTKDCIRIDNTLYDVSKQTEYLNTENVYPDKSDYNFVSVNPKFLINALKNAKVDKDNELLIGINKTSDIAPIYIIARYSDIKNIVLPKRKNN